MLPPSRLAVIDLGSNSFRLVIFSAEESCWRRIDEIYEPVRIGEGLASTGRLGEQPMERALAALDVFAHFCRTGELADESIDAVATSAIRDAENSREFLDLAHKRTGLSIRVLSREAEAHYGYLAALNSTTLSDGCVLDLGGGSMQLVRVEDRLARDSGSWALGAVRMTERFLSGGGPAKQRQLDALRAHVATELESAPWLANGGRHLVGMGGSIRNLAAATRRILGLPASGAQGTVIDRDVLDDLVRRLALLPASERSRVPGIKPVRADLILAAAVVIQVVLYTGQFDGVEVTEAGLREGIFFERYLAGADPPLFPDVRCASVMNLVGRYGIDPIHTRHVTDLALSMFDQLAELGLHKGDARERELLWAACELHDIGMSIDYEDHHKHSRYLILNGGLPGFSPAELAIVSQAARYHRKGMPDAGAMHELLDASDVRLLDRCAVLLRLAEGLERSRDQIVRDAVLSTNNGEVQLRLIADGESAVPRWAAAREGDLFARAFARELSVVA
jgi:exopolyphosphatase / guanosine-5'-triphosphate,3'-diphosphate pyrophosphatase